MSEALTIVPKEADVSLGTIQATTPEQLVTRASAAAKILAGVIKGQGLASNIQGREFVRCEGWTTLAAMLGVTPHEVDVREHEGEFVATVELRRMSDGQAITRASASCGSDDEVWGNRARYARRSMALTRATSKACRMAFSWIMVMAGYEPTPAEEVPDGGFQPESKPQNSAAKAAPADDPIVQFGLGKGKRVSEQANHDLEWLLKTVGENLNDPAKKRYEATNRKLLDALLREKQRRAANAEPPAEEEPPFPPGLDEEPPF